jgi:starvation-inducible DNA-binding protein
MMATRAKETKETKERKDNPQDGRKAELMLRTSIDLPEETRQSMIALLNEQLADMFDLFSQTKQAHWNVKGAQFFQLHKLYDDLAEDLLGHIDEIAERATSLGGAATGTARMAASATRLKEFSKGPVGSMESVRMLVDRYAAAAKSTREAIDEAEEAKDQGTMDLFVDVSRDLDKFLWFLEAHIQAHP